MHLQVAKTESLEIFGEPKLKLILLFLYNERPNTCGICLSTKCPIVSINEFYVNACPCVINQLITAAQAEYQYGLHALDLKTLPVLKCMNKVNSGYQQVVFYYRFHCQYISGRGPTRKSLFSNERFQYLSSISLSAFNPWLQDQFSKYLVYKLQLAQSANNDLRVFYISDLHQYNADISNQPIIATIPPLIAKSEGKSTSLKTDSKEKNSLGNLCPPILTKLTNDIDLFLYSCNPLQSYDKWIFYQSLQTASDYIDKMQRKFEFKTVIATVLNSTDQVEHFWKYITPCIRLYFETGSIDIQHIQCPTCCMNRSLSHLSESTDYFKIFKTECALTDLAIHFLNEMYSSRDINAYVLNTVKTRFPEFTATRQEEIYWKIHHQAVFKKVKTFSYLQTLIQCILDSEQRGSWAQIPVNAQRIFKEEYLRCMLLEIDSDLSCCKLTFKSIHIISEFVCNSDEFITGGYQTANQYLQSIVHEESMRQRREQFANNQLERLNLVTVRICRPENLYSLVSLESIVSRWVYNTSTEETLDSQLQDFAHSLHINESFLKLKARAVNNPKFNALFFEDKSANQFVESPQFRLIVQYKYSGFYETPGCDYKDQGDFQHVNVVENQCGKTCLATNGCTHYAWVPDNGGTCWMKNGPIPTASFSTTSGIYCGYLTGNQATSTTTNAPQPTTITYSEKPGCDFKDQGDFQQVAIQENQCGPTCVSSTACTHYAWVPTNGGTCWMKEGAVSWANAQSSNTPGIVCGIVEGKPIPKSNMFSGANAWFIHTQPQNVRFSIYRALQSAGFKTIRLFVREFKDYNFVDYVSNTQSIPVQDVEPTQSSLAYNDTILEMIDSVMSEVVQFNLSLIISLHDRWNLNNWQKISDIYVQKYGADKNLERFYSDESWAMPQFDNRIRHILSHKNRLMGDRTWGQIPEAVYAIEAGNEELWSANVGDNIYAQWHCNRANLIQQYISKPVLVATGGHDINKGFLINSMLNCPSVDVIAVHDYHVVRNGNSYSGRSISELNSYKSQAQQNGKQIIVEEFGCDANKDASGSTDTRKVCNEAQIMNYEGAQIPWMYWSIVGSSNNYREVWLDDPSWAMFQNYNLNRK
ncbi:hypothetical protein HDV06_004287 [Boothiomyces sp. JEL0866]|nr:hypothetical protein HDV06_004287 [Boothiomyces sp. JEL0866]